MKSLCSVVITGVAFTVAFSASADGGWHSGGGVLSSVEGNPWFVRKTTPTVKYCVDIDRVNFGASETIARAALRKALEYWKTELLENGKEIERSTSANSEIIVGPNAFEETNCESEPDLRFQFGTLSSEQKARFENPRVHVAAAVRTDYNREILKGRGFVYISPEQGPLALVREELPSNRWTQGDGRLLELTLIHELGHVFGIPHSGSGIMSSDFVENLIGFFDEAQPFWNSRVAPSLFREFTAGKIQWCFIKKSTPQCQKFEYKIIDPDRSRRIEFSYGIGDSADAPFQTVFKGKGDALVGFGGYSVSMWLPKEQKVLPEYTGHEKRVSTFSGDPFSRFFGEATDDKGKTVGTFQFELNRDDFSVWLFPGKSGATWPMAKSKEKIQKRPFPLMFRTDYLFMTSVERRSVEDRR